MPLMLKPLHRRRGPLHHALMSCSALAMLVGPLQAFASTATEQAQTQARQVQLDLPAQPLDHALTTFADQAGLHLLYTTGDVAGQSQPGLARAATASSRPCSSCCPAAA